MFIPISRRVHFHFIKDLDSTKRGHYLVNNKYYITIALPSWIPFMDIDPMLINLEIEIESVFVSAFKATFLLSPVCFYAKRVARCVFSVTFFQLYKSPTLTSVWLMTNNSHSCQYEKTIMLKRIVSLYCICNLMNK